MSYRGIDKVGRSELYYNVVKINWKDKLKEQKLSQLKATINTLKQQLKK